MFDITQSIKNKWTVFVRVKHIQAYLVIYDQLCPDNIDITTPTNQERDGSAANDVKSGGT